MSKEVALNRGTRLTLGQWDLNLATKWGQLFGDQNVGPRGLGDNFRRDIGGHYFDNKHADLIIEDLWATLPVAIYKD